MASDVGPSLKVSLSGSAVEAGAGRGECLARDHPLGRRDRPDGQVLGQALAEPHRDPVVARPERDVDQLVTDQPAAGVRIGGQQPRVEHEPGRGDPHLAGRREHREREPVDRQRIAAGHAGQRAQEGRIGERVDHDPPVPGQRDPRRHGGDAVLDGGDDRAGAGGAALVEDPEHAVALQDVDRPQLPRLGGLGCSRSHARSVTDETT